MLDTAQVPENLEGSGSERLVVVRPDVLSDAEHALGNLLQRIHHVARISRDALGGQAERFHGALGDLERLLELLFDYISPVEVELRPTDVVRIAESLAAQVQAHAAGTVRVGACPSMQMLVDARILSRSFQLLGRTFARDWESAQTTSVEVVHNEPMDRVEFLVRSEINGAAARAIDGNLALAVAVRLIELQGGELGCAPTGNVLDCRVVLPTARSSHASS